MRIPGKGGCHRIGHSYAVFLPGKGTPVKIIGDRLGHRKVESTSTYLRLAIENRDELFTSSYTSPPYSTLCLARQRGSDRLR